MMREPPTRSSPSSFRFPFTLLVAASVTVLGAGIPAPREASASVAIAVSLEELARASSVIVKVTPLERASAWEQGRIVTTTRVRVDDVIAGATPGAARELRVRTLGGRVGTIGQLVEGEATFALEQPSIVFLGPSAAHEVDARVVVMGRAQGQLVVQRDARGSEIVRVRGVGALVDRPARPPLSPSARRIVDLDGASVSAISADAKRAFEVGHAK